MNRPMDPRHDDLTPEDGRVANSLEQTARQIELTPQFQAALEVRLKNAYGRKEAAAMPLKRIVPAIVGSMALIVLAILLYWAFRALAPKPIPGTGGTSTPTPPTIPSPTILPTPIPVKAPVYPWRGTSLTLAAPLPETPAEAKVYLLNQYQPATQAEAQALAARFGIQSETYLASGDIPSDAGFIFTDGKQMLTVHSNFYWDYSADIIKNYNNMASPPNPAATGIISEFLKSHGFSFLYKIEQNKLRGGYDVRPISPDGFPLQYDYFGGPVMNISLDENGQVLAVQASLMDYSQTPVGAFGILSAQEALQRLLDDSVQAGKMEGMSSVSGPTQEWKRSYPVNQTITIYGGGSKPGAVHTDRCVPGHGRPRRTGSIEGTGQTT